MEQRNSLTIHRLHSRPNGPMDISQPQGGWKFHGTPPRPARDAGIFANRKGLKALDMTAWGEAPGR